MIEKKCIGCGIFFKSRANRTKYCNKKCYNNNVDGKERIKNRKKLIGKSNPFYGKKMTQKMKDALRLANVGRKTTEEAKIKMKEKLSNEKCYAWKGGSLCWWRKRVVERDNYTCQKCGLIDREVVEADHIKSMSDYPQLKFNLNNGMSLCANCHRRKTKQEHKERMKKIWNLKKGV